MCRWPGSWTKSMATRRARLIYLLAAGAAVCAAQQDQRTAAIQWADHYAAVYQVPRELVHSIIEVESGWQPHAVSNKGAVGLMQLMPATAVTFGVTNRFEMDQNIRGGVAYLARLLKLFNGDLRLVAAAYLTGETQILRAGLEYSNAEVYTYVAKVARLYQEKRLKRLQTEVRAPNTFQGGSQL
jgi:soluble lytic murein transglycosylase-like protein